MRWVEKSIDELGSVNRGRSRHRPRDAEHLYGGPYPFIQTGDVKHAGLYLTNHEQTYSEAGLAQSKLWKAGTLCITIAANIAETSILGIDACFPDSVIGFIANDKNADTRFVKYMFDATLKHRYRTFSQGVAQDNLSQDKLLSIKFKVPEDVIDQRSIADVLAAYDEMITNNRRRIELLEQSARLLFAEWFVRLRYPGHEHDKIVDGVPEGWEAIAVSGVISVNPKEIVPNGAELWHVPMSSLSEIGMAIDRSEFERRTKHTNVKFRNGDTLFARITPCLENGKTGFVDVLEDGDIACGSTEFIVLRGARVSAAFTYCLARTEPLRQLAIKSMTGSSGRQRVQEECFDKFRLALPPQKLLIEFDDIASMCFGQSRNLRRQNEMLTKARDLFLPRLMDGRISI